MSDQREYDDEDSDFRTSTEDVRQLRKDRDYFGHRFEGQRYAIHLYALSLMLPLIAWAGFRAYAYMEFSTECEKPLLAAFEEKTDLYAAYRNSNKAFEYIDAMGLVRTCTTVEGVTTSSCSDDNVVTWVRGIREMHDSLTHAVRESEKRDGAWRAEQSRSTTTNPYARQDEQRAHEQIERTVSSNVLEGAKGSVALEWSNPPRLRPIPDGISVYPYNGPYAIWGFISLILTVVSIFMMEAARRGSVKMEEEALRRFRVAQDRAHSRVQPATPARTETQTQDHDEGESDPQPGARSNA